MPEPVETAAQMTPSSSLGLAPKLAFAFGAQALVAVIGIVVVPIYLHLMGAEAYGLVGFYLALQGWLVLLDLGLSPTLARQLSLFRAGALAAKDASGLVLATELVFAGVAALVTAVFVVGGGWFARRWLGASTLPPEQITHCVQLLGLLMAVRWMAVLYHAGLSGLEKQNTLNAITLLAAAGRAIAAICALRWLSPSPAIFFTTQFALTLLEVFACRAALSAAFVGSGARARPAWSLLGREAHFAGSLALTSAIWVAINQADKVALSHFLPLKAFGYFSLTVVVCSGITLIAPPLTQLIYPRLTYLLAQGRRDAFMQLYRLTNSLMILIAIAAAGTIAAHPHLVFLAWTGDAQSRNLGEILTLYASGTGISLCLMVPFFLQYAQGNVRLHVLGSVLFGIVWIPAAVLSARFFGALGTGLVWLFGNVLFAVVWIPMVHRRMLSRAERGTLKGNTPVWILLAVLVASSGALPTHSVDRPTAFLVLAALASAILLLGVFAVSDLRDYALATLRGVRSELKGRR